MSLRPLETASARHAKSVDCAGELLRELKSRERWDGILPPSDWAESMVQGDALCLSPCAARPRQ